MKPVAQHLQKQLKRSDSNDTPPQSVSISVNVTKSSVQTKQSSATAPVPSYSRQTSQTGSQPRRTSLGEKYAEKLLAKNGFFKVPTPILKNYAPTPQASRPPLPAGSQLSKTLTEAVFKPIMMERRRDSAHK